MLLAHLGTVGEFVQKPDEASLGLVQARVIVTCPEHCFHHYIMLGYQLVERSGGKVKFGTCISSFKYRTLWTGMGKATY